MDLKKDSWVVGFGGGDDRTEDEDGFAWLCCEAVDEVVFCVQDEGCCTVFAEPDDVAFDETLVLDLLICVSTALESETGKEVGFDAVDDFCSDESAERVAVDAELSVAGRVCSVVIAFEDSSDVSALAVVKGDATTMEDSLREGLDGVVKALEFIEAVASVMEELPVRISWVAFPVDRGVTILEESALRGTTNVDSIDDSDELSTLDWLISVSTAGAVAGGVGLELCKSTSVAAVNGLTEPSRTDLSASMEAVEGFCAIGLGLFVSSSSRETASSSESSSVSPLLIYSWCLNSSIIVVPWTLSRLTGQ